MRSIAEFIEAAIEALPQRPDAVFDTERAHEAGERMRELRKGVMLERGDMSFRKMAHLRHKY